MAKIKKKRVGFSLDMTPMVDAAFLLLTFFMLTTQFKPPEMVQTTIPSSHSAIKLPDKDILTITIGKNNELFMGVDAQPTRERIFDREIRKLMENAGLSEAVIADSANKFRLADGFMVYTNNLERMIIAARLANPVIRPVIRGDIDADFEVIELVMNTFKKTGMPTFNLITGLEADMQAVQKQ
ncbi:MAG: biopolymer transporter ExbD [Chloroherpetonaceae bacterium]|nr:biopolymer transporter ExbD [Chloroherpetonaceae bacterium]